MDRTKDDWFHRGEKNFAARLNVDGSTRAP